MPIQRHNPEVFKEIKAYTLKRLLKRRKKYFNTPQEPEEYRKIEGAIISRNFNPFKVWDRGIITAADVQAAINELEETGFIEIKSNLLKLTQGGAKVANEILNISKLSNIDDDLFEKPIPVKKLDTAESEPTIEEIPKKATYTCPNCLEEIVNPKKYCPSCGEPIEIEMKIQCPVCGNYNDLPSAFCIKCGGKLN